MFNHFLKPLLPLALLTFGASSWSATAEDVEAMPVSLRCNQEYLSLEPLFDRRDQGMPIASALEVVERTQGVPISSRAVQLAYAYPKLPRDALSAYTRWTCHALSHWIAVRPLDEIASELESCFSQPARDRGSCHETLRLKVLGLPASYQSRSSTVVVMAPAAESSQVSLPEPGSSREPTKENPWVWTGRIGSKATGENRYVNVESIRRDGPYVKYRLALLSPLDNDIARVRDVTLDCVANARAQGDRVKPEDLQTFYPDTTVGKESTFVCLKAGSLVPTK